MEKKAIAYASDIILGRTGQVISREYQKELIRRFAEEEGIQIVAWFEDEIYDEDLMMRPGIQAMLACDEPYDMLLVERVWALARKMQKLEEFFKVLDWKNVKLESATTMWDCVSQMVRRRFNPALNSPMARRPIVRREEDEKVSVRKPKKFHFTGIAPKLQHA
jgi:DNA invertase Pin-like site-specific DNA recombinase